MGTKDGAPTTLGRPGFTFSIGSRKNIPSKWDDAEKWLINGHESPSNFMVKQCGGIKHKDLCLDNNNNNDYHATSASDIVLKDKLTNSVEPNVSKFKCLGTTEEVQEVKNRDTGTEMSPVGSTTTSRCPTPLTSLSPPRHNTPESRLLFLQGMVDQSGSELECHLANKLQPWTPFDASNSNWSSMEEEEVEISKSLRHFEMSNEFVNVTGPRPSAWEDKEMSEPCVRYQIKEAKIQAWVNLQKAKAEAETRKLEVKIQKMKSKHEEKLMKKMTIVRRKAEELRAAAQLDHSDMVAKSTKTTTSHRPSVQLTSHRGSCGCLISN